jgi:protein phosphatase
MRLGETTGLTDPGRKRRRNEDSFVHDPPLFAVADGMGGAQAGEVASRLAAAAFREYHEADDLEPEARVAAIIKEANRRIYARAREDTQASGMGTTITAALVEDERIAIGHVGDSRAYLLRGDRLEQLTDDHSLVADLVRSGRLTAREAETHPQRSVITRALGTDPEVDVDSFVVTAEPGDVFLLCSDGLTTMVGDEDILAVVRQAASLGDAGKELVRAANKQGGEDNVTVVLFRLEEEVDIGGDTAVVSGNGHPGETDLEDTLTGLEPVGWAETEEPEAQPSRPKRRWRRRVLWSLVPVALVGALVALALWGLARAYFVGAETDGRIAVYQGIPWELGAGVDLYRARYVSRLQAVQLTAEERSDLFDHSLLSYDEARERVARYEEEGIP